MKPAVGDDMQFQAIVSVAVCGFELPPKEGRLMGRQSRQCPNGGQRLLDCRLGRAGSNDCVPDWGANAVCYRERGSCQRLCGRPGGSGECEVLLVIE